MGKSGQHKLILPGLGGVMALFHGVSRRGPETWILYISLWAANPHGLAARRA
jgi:hypothetical protein